MCESTSFKFAPRISISSRKILVRPKKLAREIPSSSSEATTSRISIPLLRKSWARDARFSPTENLSLVYDAAESLSQSTYRVTPSSVLQRVSLYVSASLVEERDIVALCTIPANYHLSALQSVVKDELLRFFFLCAFKTVFYLCRRLMSSSQRAYVNNVNRSFTVLDRIVRICGGYRREREIVHELRLIFVCSNLQNARECNNLRVCWRYFLSDSRSGLASAPRILRVRFVAAARWNARRTTLLNCTNHSWTESSGRYREIRYQRRERERETKRAHI